MTANPPDARLNCPDCGKPVSAFASKCEACGRTFNPDEIKQRLNTQSDPKMLAGCLGLVLAIAALGYWLFVPSAEEKAVKAELAALEKRQAKHCISPLDGSNYYVDGYVAALMRNPKSYEHIKTNTAPVGVDGNHEFIVTFRAENGFGGKASGMAVGKFSNESCEVVEAKLVDTK